MRKQTQDTYVTCARCGGTGKTALPRHQQEVLDYLLLHGESAASEIQDGLGLDGGPSMMAQRLYGMHRMGLVVRTAEKLPIGRRYVYSVAEQAPHSD